MALACCLTATGSPLLLAPAGADPDRPGSAGADGGRPAAGQPAGQPAGQTAGQTGDPGADPGRRWRHSSDGEVGPIAPPLPEGRPTAPVISNRHTWRVVPGVRAKVWDQSDPRGKIRAYLLKIDLTNPRLKVDYLSGADVRERGGVLGMVTDDGAVAGVNGDFFDIFDTGAPLGVGADRQRGLRAAVRWGWTKSFQLTRHGPRVKDAELRAWIRQRPGIEITNVNSPTVPEDGLGLYTRAWGRTVGSRVTDDQTATVREVVIKDGVVVSNRSELSRSRRITGKVLIGRGQAAEQLTWLPVGLHVDMGWRIAGRPRVAIGGSGVLVRHGEVIAVDDREMHPRTAVGIDRDSQSLLLLVVDGRQDFSRGYTLVEVARLLVRLGAEAALNLDGGGSSTMVARTLSGRVGLVNSPSDGEQRTVPNGLAVYRLPRS